MKIMMIRMKNKRITNQKTNKDSVKDWLQKMKDVRNQVVQNTMVIVIFTKIRMFDIKYSYTMFIV